VLIVSAADLTPVLGDTILWSKDVERVFASSPSAALDVARAFAPSLVVLDGGDAPPTLGLIRRLREHPGTRRSSIVVVSASPAPALEEEALQAGANLALGAPVDSTEWDTRFARLLAVPQRLRTRFPVRLQPMGPGGAGPRAGEALDISVSGMLVQTDTRLEPGAGLELRFTLPGGGPELRATASVVRTSPGTPARMGLAFRRLEGDAAERIQALLATAPVARAFGRYEVLEQLGEGSMGCVYRAFDPVAQRLVAIKTLKPELLASADADDYARRFRREAQAAAKLVHPNIVTIFDVGDDYFVMELLEGATLQALLRERGRLDAATACRILAPVADALDHAHARGTIHRDVKPANIMILPDGRPKVMDFGVAHVVSGSTTATGQVFGSPFYMAPEQITRNEASPRTDIFSLGVVAYEALTGRKPVEADGVTSILYHVVHTAPPRASTCSPGLASHHDRALERALAKEPGVRFSTAAAFVAALQSGAGDDAVPPAPSGVAVGPEIADPTDPRVETHDLRHIAAAIRTGAPRRPAWAAAAVLALAAIAAGFAVRARRPRVERPSTPPGLAITTSPPGATVWLDDAAVGTTPLFLSNVPPASHRVRVAAEGYVSSELSVRTTDEATPMPLRFILQPATGTLEIDSEPARATVRVDGEARGTTPFSDGRMSPGTHRILVELPGHRPFSRAVDVGPGKTERLLAHLERTTEAAASDKGLRLRGWVRVGDLVVLGPGVTPPWKIAGEPAPYPQEARRLQIEGTVAVELTVSDTGDVVDARVVESAGELLDEAFLAAVLAWRYEPAESNGVKVRVRIVERQAFSLSG
jgi:serine/threonine-protein kinase